MFLRRVSRKHIRFQKLRHLLLLLLRVRLFVFLALAFSRPYRDLPHAAAAPGQETIAHIILLDNSLSMGYGDRWQRANAGAAEIAREARPGDSLALIEFSDQAMVLVPLGTDRALALSQIENGAKLTDRPTRYAQALRTAESLAADARARPPLSAPRLRFPEDRRGRRRAGLAARRRGGTRRLRKR